MDFAAAALAALLAGAEAGASTAAGAASAATEEVPVKILVGQVSGGHPAQLAIAADRLPKTASGAVLLFDVTPRSIVPEEHFGLGVAAAAGALRETIATMTFYPPAQEGVTVTLAAPVSAPLLAAAHQAGMLTIELRLLVSAGDEAALRSVLVVDHATLHGS